MKSVISSDQLLTLQQSGNLVFPTNLSFLAGPDLERCRVIQEPSGHVVYFGPHGNRILAADPEGNPLHECEWVNGAEGTVELVRARVQLDWGEWVGLKPSGIVHSTTLDLTSQKDWQKLQGDDLRKMAAQTIGVELGEVKFFYTDEDLAIGVDGQARIRHRKDALYVLKNGTFDGARFMACMGAMHWDRIDFLPVVELFQSLLPGTGSAIFELIHGLYSDQCGDHPVPLRYRGVPTYPSEAAYRLFGGFFSPQVPNGENPFPIFMNPARSQEVRWLPAREVPRRYFDKSRSLCVTVKWGKIQKLTMTNDTSGMSFVAPNSLGLSPCGKTVIVVKGKIHLHNGEGRTLLDPLNSWGTIVDSEENLETKPGLTWKSFFLKSMPSVDARSAFSAVLLYPEDETEIEEEPSQPFVGDYIQDILSDHEQLTQHLRQANKVLITNIDGAISSCLHFDRPREYDIVYQNQALAQKHAQRLWTQLAFSQRLDWGKNFRFHYKNFDFEKRPHPVFDLILYWTPFSLFRDEASLEEEVKTLAKTFHSKTVGFVAGPLGLASRLDKRGLTVMQAVPGEAFPGFFMHKALLPHAQLRHGLTLFIVVKQREEH